MQHAATPVSHALPVLFTCISRSFSTTSSVLLMSRFCSVWIFWIISYVLGSLPSSLRHL